MFFWQKVDYDWKSCAQRHKAQEQKKSSRKGKLRRLFCNRLFWALVCLLATAIVSFHGYDVHASYTPYVFFGGLALSIWVSGRRGVETGQDNNNIFDKVIGVEKKIGADYDYDWGKT